MGQKGGGGGGNKQGQVEEGVNWGREARAVEGGCQGHKNLEMCSGLWVFISFTFLIKRDKEWGGHQSHSDFPVKVLEGAVN